MQCKETEGKWRVSSKFLGYGSICTAIFITARNVTAFHWDFQPSNASPSNVSHRHMLRFFQLFREIARRDRSSATQQTWRTSAQTCALTRAPSSRRFLLKIFANYNFCSSMLFYLKYAPILELKANVQLSISIVFSLKTSSHLIWGNKDLGTSHLMSHVSGKKKTI